MRLHRLVGEVEGLTTKMREAAIEAEEADKRADEFFQKIEFKNTEIERLRAEARQ